MEVKLVIEQYAPPPPCFDAHLTNTQNKNKVLFKENQ